MGQSVLKTVFIYTVILVTAVALAFILVLIPAYVHYAASHVPGAYDALYLSGYSPYDTIVVEIDYQPGQEPDPEAVRTLSRQIEQYSGKEVVVHISQDIGEDEVPGVIFGDDIFDAAFELQHNHRDEQTGWFGGNVTLYIMYLDTVWHPDDSDYSGSMPPFGHAAASRVYSVGVTYAADSIIIFKHSIVEEGMETTILLHELGHVWGLDHSNAPNDVMNAQFNIYNDGSSVDNPDQSGFPTDFSDADREKLVNLNDSLHVLPLFLP